nr:uncharacterized protein LOC123762520 isoform X3 [Procambarus clarkii]
MEEKLLKVCVVLWKCWTLVIVLGNHIPSSASFPKLSSPINSTTPLYSTWLQQSSLTTSPGLHQSPLTTSSGPARSPSQHPPLVSTRDVPLTGNTPMGETQSSGQNTLQPTVSHLYPDMTLLPRKKSNCFSEAVHVSNNLKAVMKTDRQSGTLYFYPEDDFEFVRIILTVTHGEQDGVFNKEDLCVKDGPRWYTLEFNAGYYDRRFKVDTWGINVKVDKCENKSPFDYLYGANWFHHMKVVAKGSSYWSTKAPGPDCLNSLPDHTTAGTAEEEPETSVSTLPSAADDTHANGHHTRLLVIVLTSVLSVAFLVVVVFLHKRRGGKSSSAQTPASPAAESPESPIYENVIRFSDHSSASHTGPEGSLENPVYENINLVELRGGAGTPHDSVDADCQHTAAPGERGSAHVSENSVYGAVCQPTAAPGERGSAHVSENSVYGAVCQPTAAPGERGSAHVSENSVYGAVF